MAKLSIYLKFERLQIITISWPKRSEIFPVYRTYLSDVKAAAIH
jgi:hypothetical protein